MSGPPGAKLWHEAHFEETVWPAATSAAGSTVPQSGGLSTAWAGPSAAAS